MPEQSEGGRPSTSSDVGPRGPRDAFEAQEEPESGSFEHERDGSVRLDPPPTIPRRRRTRAGADPLPS